MKTAIILHGMPSKEGYYNPESEAQSNEHWLPWIQKKLILKDILAQAIELPKPYNPVYEDWKKVFEQLNVNEETILIGHSCGGGFLIRWLSENNVKVGKVALIAPWIDIEGELENNFFDFQIDRDFPKKTKKVDIFYSDDDEKELLSSRDFLKEKVVDAHYHDLKGRGHFVFSDMGTREFPELLDVLTNDK